MRFRSLVRTVFGRAARPRPGLSEQMARRAQEAAAARRHLEAGVLYAEALSLQPERLDWRIQCGHMFKEAGDLAAAERHYRLAAEQSPEDADLPLQLGHFFKCAGRLDMAVRWYRRALELRPGWSTPRLELLALEEAGWRGQAPEPAPADTAEGFGERSLVPELAPQPPVKTLQAHAEGVEFLRLGRPERTYWGVGPTLRGVEAIRGYCMTAVPALIVQINLNDRMVYRGGPGPGRPLRGQADDDPLRKYVFNVWIDLSGFVEGQYELECRVTDLDGRILSRRETVVIVAPPATGGILPDSDGIVPPPDPGDPRSLEEQINSRPSMVRAGRRALLQHPPASVLVQRPDQLGDLAVSVPALRRIRELLPQARIVGLVSRANKDFALTLGLFDELVTLDFPDSETDRRRVMPIEAQRDLAARLRPFAFDMAIDLSENPASRLLMPLSGAPVLVGFRAGEMPWLTVEAGGDTHDRWNGHEIAPHTNKLLGLVEWLAAMLRSEPNILRREDLDPARLAGLGLAPETPFAVLHDGARLAFSRWPHYLELARMILAETGLDVVMMSDDRDSAARLPDDLAGSGRFHYIDRILPFDDLDALLSLCAVFVGNDSGPKHLAALRGAKVVSLHTARNNWNEWGQESGGYVISRKLPCAGCLIWREPEDCGKDYVCIRGIAPGEVLAAVLKLLEPSSEILERRAV